LGLKKENLIQTKSYNFAIRIVKLYKFLIEKRKEFVLSKQVLRSGTSIGANVEEAISALSKADFVARMGIAFKEARETHFWLRLLRDSGYLSTAQAESMLQVLDEILRIISSIIVTSKSKLKRRINF